MNTTHILRRGVAGLAAAALVSLGSGAGIAQAEPLGPTSGTWCPGQPVPGGFTEVNWDWNICHNYLLQIMGNPPAIVGMKIQTGARGGCWPTVAGVSSNPTGDRYCGF